MFETPLDEALRFNTSRPRYTTTQDGQKVGSSSPSKYLHLLTIDDSETGETLGILNEFCVSKAMEWDEYCHNTKDKELDKFLDHRNDENQCTYYSTGF